MEVLGKVLVTMVIAFNIMALFVWLMFRNKLGGNFPVEPEHSVDSAEENEEKPEDGNDRTDEDDR